MASQGSFALLSIGSRGKREGNTEAEKLRQYVYNFKGSTQDLLKAQIKQLRHLKKIFIQISNYSSLPAIGGRQVPEKKGPLTPKPSDSPKVLWLLALKNSKIIKSYKYLSIVYVKMWYFRRIIQFWILPMGMLIKYIAPFWSNFDPLLPNPPL